MFNLADYGTDPNEIVVTAEPKPKQGPPDCPSGPRIVFGRSFGGTAFAGVGERARGGSLNAGVGLSLPLRSLITGRLSGTQVYANATLPELVKGVGAFGAVTTGRSVGSSNGTLSCNISIRGDPGQ